MSNDAVLMAVAGPIATITLNRPAQLNALDEQMRLDLAATLAAAAREPGVRAVILTGAGRSFCVGQNLANTGELEDCEDCIRRTYNPIAEQMATLSVPVIAAINGPAVGAGMGFALGCDMVLMAEGSFLSCAFGKVGLIPDSGTTYHLVRAAGYLRAFEIATTGRRILPAEAVALGLANRHVPADLLMTEAHALASSLAGESAKAVGLTKRLLRQAADGTLASALSAEALAQGVAGQSAAHQELRAAFLNRKRA